MTATEILAVHDRYETAFGDLDEVARPGLFADARFLALLETAMRRGSALTRAEAESAFPQADWECDVWLDDEREQLHYQSFCEMASDPPQRS